MHPATVVASVLIFAAVLGLVLFGQPVVGRWSARRRKRYSKSLNELFIFSASPRSLLWSSLGSAVATGAFVWLLWGSVWVAVAGAWAGSFVPSGVLRVMASRRRERLEAQLVDGVLALSNSVRAGLTLVDAIRLVEENAPAPISQEFGLVLREYEHGVALEQALDNATLRIPNPSYKLVFGALKTGRERGGNISETLDRVRDSVCEIHRLEERVRTLTAQGRLAAKIMLIMPIFIGVILYMLDPQGIALLFTDPIGHVLLLIIVVLDVLGLLWIRKIIHVDV